MSRKKWNDRSDVFARQENQECVSQTEVEPVSVSDEESHSVAECAVRESVRTTRARDHCTELRVDRSAEQGDYSAEYPHRHEESATGKCSCNRSWRPENSAADRCANDDCESERPAEYSQQGRLAWLADYAPTKVVIAIGEVVCRKNMVVFHRGRAIFRRTRQPGIATT